MFSNEGKEEAKMKAKAITIMLAIALVAMAGGVCTVQAGEAEVLDYRTITGDVVGATQSEVFFSSGTGPDGKTLWTRVPRSPGDKVKTDGFPPYRWYVRLKEEGKVIHTFSEFGPDFYGPAPNIN